MDFIPFNKSHTLRCFSDKIFSVLAPVDVAESQISYWSFDLITRLCEAQQCLQKGLPQCTKSCLMATVFWVKDEAVVLALLSHRHGHMALNVYMPLGLSVSAE